MNTLILSELNGIKIVHNGSNKSIKVYAKLDGEFEVENED